MRTDLFHRRLPFLPLLLGAALLAACGGGGETASPADDTLAEDAWPTETWNGEAGSTKKVLAASISAGALETTEIFTEDFRGEDFAERPTRNPGVRSAVVLREWDDVPAQLDAETFRQRWNAYLVELGEVQTVEKHTWEIQLRPGADGSPGLEVREALWVLAQLADGRLREDRLYLVLDLVKRGEEWKIAGVRSADGRTTVAPGPFFRDVTSRVLPPGYDQIGAQIYTDGGPVLADFDADGDIDLFAPRLHAPARLYANDGHGMFDDVTAAWGLELNALRDGTNSGLFLDVDRDGRLDLVVGSKSHGLLVFENDGARLRDATGPEPLGGAGEWESLAAADVDGDGWIDLYACNYNLIDTEHQPESYVDARDGLGNVLLRNSGDVAEGEARFADVTEQAGLAPNRERWSYAAAWADYDRDGDMDLFVANDYGPKSLYRNRGDGTFEEVAAAVGAEDFGNGMGASWADLDGDLWLDIYSSNMQSFAGNRITRLETFPGTDDLRALYRRFAAGNTLLRNAGPGADGQVTFEDITDDAGVRGAFWAWGNLAFDYDSDLDLDLFVCGGFYTGAEAKDT